MPTPRLLRDLFGCLFIGCAVLAPPAAPTAVCETGVLDAGENGMNVLTYRLCPETLTIGFEASEVVEEMSCDAQGKVRLWTVTGNERCAARPETEGARR